MKKLLKINILLIFFTLVASQVDAQKFGHVNTGNILAKMPATLESDSLLRLFRDSLVSMGEERAKALKAEFDAFLEVYNQGSVTPVVAQQKQAEFQQKEQELIAYEEELTNLVGVRRQELLEPIIGQLSKAIEEVGKEGGYTMIFDTSVFNAIVFAKDSDDLTELVKTKLNLQ